MSLAKGLKSRIILILMLVLVVWAVSVFFIIADPPFIRGIIPRSSHGLLGIFITPFVHSGFPHLITNTVGLASLGWLVAWRGVAYFSLCTLIIIVLRGFGVWVFGRFSMHLGASGLIFGYFGFLVARGFVEKSFRAILFGAIVLIGYGGMI